MESTPGSPTAPVDPPAVPRTWRGRLHALVPTEGKLRGTWIHRLMGERVFDPRLWRFTQHAVASGLAVGIFTTMLPILGLHVPAAVAAAFAVRGNLPCALLTTLVANPFTLPFLLVAQVRLGHVICRYTGTNDYGELPWKLEKMLHAVKPLLIGSFLTAAVAAGLLYFGTHALWGFVEKRRFAPRPEEP